jgi:hypothetical protein
MQHGKPMGWIASLPTAPRNDCFFKLFYLHVLTLGLFPVMLLGNNAFQTEALPRRWTFNAVQTPAPHGENRGTNY